MPPTTTPSNTSSFLSSYPSYDTYLSYLCKLAKSNGVFANSRPFERGIRMYVSASGVLHQQFLQLEQKVDSKNADNSQFRKNLQELYVIGYRFVHLYTNFIKKHPKYATLDSSEKSRLIKEASHLLNRLETIKQGPLKDLYQEIADEERLQKEKQLERERLRKRQLELKQKQQQEQEVNHLKSRLSSLLKSREQQKKDPQGSTSASNAVPVVELESHSENLPDVPSYQQAPPQQEYTNWNQSEEPTTSHTTKEGEFQPQQPENPYSFPTDQTQTHASDLSTGFEGTSPHSGDNSNLNSPNAPSAPPSIETSENQGVDLPPTSSLPSPNYAQSESSSSTVQDSPVTSPINYGTAHTIGTEASSLSSAAENQPLQSPSDDLYIDSGMTSPPVPTYGQVESPSSNSSAPHLEVSNDDSITPTNYQQTISHHGASNDMPSSQDSSSPKKVHINQRIVDEFLNYAYDNLECNLEFCGVLVGKLKDNEYYITHCLLPDQEGTSDACHCLNEMEIFEYQSKHDLLSLGWIHTHPTQKAFLSTIDLVTQYGYQIMIPEAVAIVCAPQSTPHQGVFRIKDDAFPTVKKAIENDELIAQGKKHARLADAPLYEACPHALCSYEEDTSATIIDLRKNKKPQKAKEEKSDKGQQLINWSGVEGGTVMAPPRHYSDTAIHSSSGMMRQQNPYAAMPRYVPMTTPYIGHGMIPHRHPVMYQQHHQQRLPPGGRMTHAPPPSGVVQYGPPQQQPRRHSSAVMHYPNRNGGQYHPYPPGQRYR